MRRVADHGGVNTRWVFESSDDDDDDDDGQQQQQGAMKRRRVGGRADDDGSFSDDDNDDNGNNLAGSGPVCWPQMREAGGTADDLRIAGCSAAQWRACGFSAEHAKPPPHSKTHLLATYRMKVELLMQAARGGIQFPWNCLLYTSPSPRDA